MLADEIIDYCVQNLSGVAVVESWGERGVFYNPENKLKRGVYVLTVKEKDARGRCLSSSSHGEVRCQAPWQ